MPLAPTRWIKQLVEFRPKEEIDLVPRGTRGIYVLFRLRRRHYGERYDVVYVGLSKTGVRARLRSHRKSRRKGSIWTHFSVFEVWDNVSDAEIGELEGIFRHVYRKDSKANMLNVQKTHRPLKKVRVPSLDHWKRA